MKTMRSLLVLSIILNIALAIMLGRQRSAPDASSETDVSADSSAYVIETSLDPQKPPQIDPSQGDTLRGSPLVVGHETSPFRAPTKGAAKPLPNFSIEPARVKPIDIEPDSSAEFTKPNIMWQVPPRPDLKPGRSTSFSKPDWDEHPVLRKDVDR